MDPLAPATSTLAPAISHIAETAATLANELGKTSQNAPTSDQRKAERQRQLIERAVRGPATLKELVEEDRHEDAAKEWSVIQKILEKCQNGAGAQALKEDCERIMNSDSD